MIHKIYLWGIIGACLLYSPLFACTTDIDIPTALKQSDIPNLIQVSNNLIDCPAQDTLAIIYHKLGILYRHINIDSSIYYAEQAVDIRTTLQDGKPFIDLGKSLHNLGVFYKMSGDYLLAIPYFEKAVSVYQQLDHRDRIRRSMLELGELYRIEGDYLKSETQLHFLINDATKDEEYSKARALLNLGYTFIDQLKYAEAIQVLQQSLDLLKSYDNSSDLAAIYLNMGLTFKKMTRLEESLNYYLKALRIYKKDDNCEDIAKIANNIGNLLLVSEGEKTLLKAKSYFELGLEKTQICQNLEMTAQSFDGLGEVYLGQNNLAEANTYFTKALQTLLPNIKFNTKLDHIQKEILANSSYKTDLLVYLSDKTRALKALYHKDQNPQHLTEALYFLDAGDFLIDELRQNHNDQSTKLFWRQEVLSFYEKAIEFCTLLNNPDKAFYYFEKSKSILLLEALLSSNALQSIPDSLQRKVKYLKRQIRLKRASIGQTNQQDKADTFKEILSLEENLNELNLAIAEQYPQLKAINTQKKVVDINAFKQVYLQEQNRTLVHYFYGQEHVYALVLSQHENQVVRLGTSDEINTLVRDFLQYFEQADRIESAPKDYLQQAHQVYHSLIHPLALDPQSELLIIPAGILTYLPFEALVTENDDAFGMATAPYFVLKHQLWYGFSATLFDQIEQRTLGQSPKSLLALAPFANTSTSQYPALSFSQDELSTIRSYVQTDLYVDQEANLDVFLKNQPDYSVLHLSTHAFSSFSATQPFIVFSDTILDLAELYQQHIPANLVVLSACQTQIGKLAPGEGVLGLNRGFFYAGARSVVSSLWNMNAQSTSNLLSSFYKSMYEGMPKYLALQEAKKTYLLNENIPSYQKSPYYWAGMSYYGDSEGWAVQSSRNWPYYLGALLAIVFGFGFWKIKKK